MSKKTNEWINFGEAVICARILIDAIKRLKKDAEPSMTPDQWNRYIEPLENALARVKEFSKGNL